MQHAVQQLTLVVTLLRGMTGCSPALSIGHYLGVNMGQACT